MNCAHLPEGPQSGAGHRRDQADDGEADEHDLEVNVKAEQEIEMVLHHLEQQNDMLIAMLEKQGIKLEEALGRTARANLAKSGTPPG
jgi:uncharacterized membrane protein